MCIRDRSRAGINMTRHELHQKDMVITPLIFQGQSPSVSYTHLDVYKRQTILTVCDLVSSGCFTSHGTTELFTMFYSCLLYTSLNQVEYYLKSPVFRKT